MTLPLLRVGNLMTVDPITIGPEAPAVEAERLLKQYRITGLPVIDNDEVIGVISQTDLVTARSSELIGGNWGRLRVRHLMTRPVVTVPVTATVRRAARLMRDEHIHRIVVIDDDGHPVGVLTTTDLPEVLLDPELETGDEDG